MPTTVCIILCTRNRAESLRLTLSSLEQVRVPPWLSPRLLVVDNASTDATGDLLAALRLGNMPHRVTVEDQPGLSRCRNRGIRESDGDILLFTDDDVRLPTQWLERMCRPMEAGRVQAVAGGVRLAGDLLPAWAGPYVRASLASTESLDATAPGTLVGANMAISRQALTRVPGFDEELGAGALGFGEETLFAWQLLETGATIGSALDAAVEHHFHPSRLGRAALLAAARASGRSRAYIDWHWSHEPTECVDGSRRSIKRGLHIRLKLLQHRLSRRRRPPAAVSDWEMFHVMLLEYRRQLGREMGRPRNYERRGLRKISPRETREPLAGAKMLEGANA